MNISFIIQSISRLAGGLSSAVRPLSQALSMQQDLSMEVFSLIDHYTTEDIELWHPLKPQCFPVRGLAAFGYAPKLVPALVHSHTDLLHTQGGLWLYTTRAGDLWAKFTKKPYLISPHGMLDPWAVQNSFWKKRLVRMLFVDNYLHRASCIHSLCLPETLAIRKYGLKNPICQIPNGVLLPDKQTVYPPPAWLQQFPPGKKILLYLGRIHPKKGLPLLLKAWAWLHKQRSPHTEEWGLAIAGWDQGGHLAVLRNMVNELGLENSVRFIGFQDETAKQVTYQYVKGFILPSYSEGMPMTILEAWAHYLPVVMTKECNLPEGFTTQAAMEIKPDETDIAKRLNDLFSLSDRERTTMGNHGRHLVEEKFTWPIIATQMREVYEWILGGGPPPSSMVIE